MFTGTRVMKIWFPFSFWTTGSVVWPLKTSRKEGIVIGIQLKPFTFWFDIKYNNLIQKLKRFSIITLMVLICSFAKWKWVWKLKFWNTLGCLSAVNQLQGQKCIAIGDSKRGSYRLFINRSVNCNMLWPLFCHFLIWHWCILQWSLVGVDDQRGRYVMFSHQINDLMVHNKARFVFSSFGNFRFRHGFSTFHEPRLLKKNLCPGMRAFAVAIASTVFTTPPFLLRIWRKTCTFSSTVPNINGLPRFNVSTFLSELADWFAKHFFRNALAWYSPKSRWKCDFLNFRTAAIGPLIAAYFPMTNRSLSINLV